MRRQIAMQDCHRADLLQWRSKAADYILSRHNFGTGNGIAEGTAGDAERFQIQKRAEFTHQSWQAARMVEVLHVVRPGGLDIEQYRNFASQLIECIVVEFYPGATCHR